MDIPKVYILKSTNPIEILEEGTGETYEYLAKIQQNDKILQFVKDLKITSPNLPMDITKYAGQNLEDLYVMQNEFLGLPMDLTIDHVLQEIGFSKDFHKQIFLLVYFNSFIDLKYYEGFVPKDIKFVVGNRNIINSVLDSKYEVCSLNIPFITSQRGLINYIKANWKDIEKQMDDNLSQNPYIKRIHLNTKIGIDISDLKDNQDKTWDEIADILTPKYLGDFPNVADTNWLRKTYTDFKLTFSLSTQ